MSSGSRLGFIAAAAAVLVAADGAGAQTDVVIYGLVRDFRTDHPDFGVTGAGAHVAGNIDPKLSSLSAPAFTGAGFTISTQWLDSSSRPMAPHLYMIGQGPVVPVSAAPTIDNNSYADTYDPDLGPYGGANVGAAPRFFINPLEPVVTEPTNLPPPIAEWKRDSNGGMTTLSTDLDCQKFLVGNGHIVQIFGDVTVLARDEFKVQNHGQIMLLPGATFTVYGRKVITFQDQCVVGDPADTTRTRIYNSGTEPVILQNQVSVYATVISPDGLLQVQDGSNFYGNYTGKGVFLKNSGGLHIAGRLPRSCGFAVTDTPGTIGAFSTGDITSAATFGQWFSEAPGHNACTAHPITMTPLGGGFREFRSTAFYPIDDELYGNEGEAHNRNFTFMLRTKFIFRECADQIIEMQGSDDIWVFVNDDLVIDLGGIAPNQRQVAEIDRMDIDDGETAMLTVFYAHRSGATPSFGIRTNLDLQPVSSEIAMFHGWD